MATMTRVPRTFAFADDELDDVECPRCGGPLDATEPLENDDGDFVQIAFCRVCCPVSEKSRAFLLPRSLIRVRG